MRAVILTLVPVLLLSIARVTHAVRKTVQHCEADA